MSDSNEEGQDALGQLAAPQVRASAKPRRALTWCKRLAALLFGFLVAGLLTELAVLALFGEQAKFPRRVVEAPWGLRYNEPGARYRHASADGKWIFQINNQGMRSDRDYEHAKPDGTYRVASLGDSFTVGYEVHEPECFSRVLERELRAKGLNVEVLNFGVSGYSTAEALLYLEREILRYEPDVVLLTFFFNDLVDNPRTGLFEFRDGSLVEGNANYVPGGRIANFLNTNAFFSFLAARSNAFVFAKERLTTLGRTLLIKSQHREEEEDGSTGAAGSTVPPENAAADAGEVGAQWDERQAFTAAILERLYATCRERDIPLVIQSIPLPRLLDMFPVDQFHTDRPGIHYLPMAPLLGPPPSTPRFYNPRSHAHWTAAAHELSGKALAELVLREELLASP